MTDVNYEKIEISRSEERLLVAAAKAAGQTVETTSTLTPDGLGPVSVIVGGDTAWVAAVIAFARLNTSHLHGADVTPATFTPDTQTLVDLAHVSTKLFDGFLVDAVSPAVVRITDGYHTIQAAKRDNGWTAEAGTLQIDYVDTMDTPAAAVLVAALHLGVVDPAVFLSNIANAVTS